MCTSACIQFGKKHLRNQEVFGKKVIEVGSYNVNGSLRSVVEPLRPHSYIGVDIANGPGVDEICDISRLVRRFGKDAFDVVICTEVIEHVRDWRTAISNLKNIVSPGGVLIMTTRSLGFPHHSYPHDFWRYEVSDIETLFGDMKILSLERDAPDQPGVLLKAVKPYEFTERRHLSLELYSMTKLKRCKDNTVAILAWKLDRKLRLREKLITLSDSLARTYHRSRIRAGRIKRQLLGRPLP